MKTPYLQLILLASILLIIVLTSNTLLNNTPDPIPENTPLLVTTNSEIRDTAPAIQEVVPDQVSQQPNSGPIATPAGDTGGFIVQNNAQPSQNTAEPTSAMPKITSIEPERVTDGEDVIITGTGFTQNMTVIVRYGFVEQRTIVSSLDGRTTHFTFRSPLPETINTNLSQEAQQQLTQSLEDTGQTLETLLASTESTGNIVDQYAVILVINGETIVSPQKLHHVR